MKLYDAHNHLQDESLRPHLDRIAADLTSAGIVGAVVNGTTPDDWSAVSALATRFPWVVPSYGVHPWDCGNRPSDWQRLLAARIAADPRARIGEIGLDRWILDRASPDDPRLTGLRRAPLAEQTDVFLWQLELAAQHNFAASIHCTDAWGALLDALQHAKLPACGFLLHAYSGPVELVESFTDLGAYFSFNGSYLDDRRSRQRNTFQSVPPDRLLVETDSPAMPLPAALEKFALPSSSTDSRLNHPANLSAVYHGLAAFIGTPVETLAMQVEQNFSRLYGD